MLSDLKKSVCRANKILHKNEAHFTWCSVSGFDPSMGLFVVRPGGVPYEQLQPELMLVMSMDGQKLEGRLNPVNDVDTHRAMYMTWAMSGTMMGAIAHTYSPIVTAFAQAEIPLLPTGAKHSEFFHDAVPVTRKLTQKEIEGDYEYCLGELAVKTAVDPVKTPAVLVSGHGGLIWGSSIEKTIERTLVLEDLAYVSHIIKGINPNVSELDISLRDRRWQYRQ